MENQELELVPLYYFTPTPNTISSTIISAFIICRTLYIDHLIQTSPNPDLGRMIDFMLQVTKPSLSDLPKATRHMS